jgi:hypothetical protein
MRAYLGANSAFSRDLHIRTGVVHRETRAGILREKLWY